MDIRTLKVNLAKKILNTQNQELLIKIDKIFQREVEDDCWDQLPKEVQDSISEGIEDVKNGKVYTHDQVIQEAKQKYGF